MDPMFPLVIIAAIAGAATLAWRTARAHGHDGGLRTSWKVICYACAHDRRRAPAEPDCEECRSARMMPLSKYQAEGGGTGFGLDRNGPFVSSLCEGEWTPTDDPSNRPVGRWHAPLFDLDFDVAWHPVTRRLGILKPVPREAWLQLLYAMEAEKLIPHGFAGREARHRGRRSEAEGIEGYRAAGDSGLLTDATLCLSVPAKVVPSGTPGHGHLYLETRLPWDAYLGIMRLMVDAGLLEKDWVDLSERRRMAILRKPEFKKVPS